LAATSAAFAFSSSVAGGSFAKQEPASAETITAMAIRKWHSFKRTLLTDFDRDSFALLVHE
jgi:hypothetical protein